MLWSVYLPLYGFLVSMVVKFSSFHRDCTEKRPKKRSAKKKKKSNLRKEIDLVLKVSQWNYQLWTKKTHHWKGWLLKLFFFLTALCRCVGKNEDMVKYSQPDLKVTPTKFLMFGHFWKACWAKNSLQSVCVWMTRKKNVVTNFIQKWLNIRQK